MAPELKGMLKVGVAVLLKVSVGWLLVAGPEEEVVRVLPKPPKPLVPLPPLPPATVWAELARGWLKEVPAAAAVAAAAGDLPNWKMEDRAGAELAAVTGGAPPKRRVCEVDVTVLLALLATVVTPKPNTSLEAEAVVPEAAVEAAVPRPVKRGDGVAVVVAAAAVCFREKGAAKGMAGKGSTLSKMGLKVGAGVLAVLAVLAVVVLDEVVVAAEAELDGKGLSLSLLGVARKMGLNMGEAQAGPGVAREEVAGGLSIPNSMLGFGVGEGAEEAGVLTGCSA